MDKHALLVIGLDGATFDVIDPLLNEGRMPFLASMMTEAAYGILESTIPPLTGPAWVSLATGKNPGKTGAFEFFNRTGPGLDLKPISSEMFKRNAFWDYLSDAGRKVCILNYPMLFPPYPIHGCMISGLGSSPMDAFAYPPELHHEIDEIAGGYEISVPYNNPIYSNNEERFFVDLFRLLDKQERVTKYLLQKDEWDVFLVVFSATDFLQHYGWKHFDPSHPLYDQTHSPRHAEAFKAVWTRIDQVLAEVIGLVEPDTTVMMASDHGFGPEDQTFYINQWLRAEGYLRTKKWKGHSLSQVYPLIRRLARSTVAKLAPTAYERLKRGHGENGRVWLRLKKNLIFDQIDVERSKAFALETGFGGIFLNRAALSERECADLKIEIRDKLQRYPGFESVEVWFSDDIYSGPYTALAPDIQLSINNYRCGVRVELSSKRIYEPRPFSPNRSGNHRLDGVLIVKGPNIDPGNLPKSKIIDIAPTLLYMQRVPIPLDMDGEIIREIFSPAHLAQHPIEYVQGLVTKGSETTLSREDEEALLEHLRGLGYL